MDDSAFWRAQGKRFDKLRDAKQPKERLLGASFNPNGWGLNDVPAFKHCVADRWLLRLAAPSTIDEFKSVAGVCAVALGCPNTDDAWADWLDYLRRASVDFRPGFTITSYPADARPNADAEVISTELGEIEDVCRASAHFCRKLADECQKAELTRKAEPALEREPSPGRSRIEKSEFWRDLRAEFRSVQNRDHMYADAQFDLVASDASSRGYFKALARRGGTALGAAPNEAFRAWLNAVAGYLGRGRHPWLHRTRAENDALIAIGEDQYAMPGAHGGLVLEADTWIEHICEASAELCTALETESFEWEVRVNTTGQSSARTATVASAERPAQPRAAVIWPLLKQRGLTRSGWAAKAGVDPSVVYDYMAGKSNPRPESRKVLAEVIKLPELPD